MLSFLGGKTDAGISDKRSRRGLLPVLPACGRDPERKEF